MVYPAIKSSIFETIVIWQIRLWNPNFHMGITGLTQQWTSKFHMEICISETITIGLNQQLNIDFHVHGSIISFEGCKLDYKENIPRKLNTLFFLKFR